MGKEETLKKWLPRKRRRAVIYDFDNTIFESPGREAGEAAYLEGTGQLWPYGGWWGRVETLMPPIVPDPIPESMFIARTLAAYRVDRQREDTNCYLMTGRPAKMRHRVKEILATQGMEFDEYFFRGMPGSPHHGDTLDIKLGLIRKEIVHPGLEELEIWEDRPEHTSRFCTEARRWKKEYDSHLQKVIVHDILAETSLEF